MIKRKNLFFVLCLLSALVFSFPLGAKESALPNEFYQIIEGIEGEIGEYLPDDVRSDDEKAVGDSVSKMANAKYILDVIGDLVGIGLKDALSLLAALLGILILSAIFSAFRSSFNSEAISRVVSICSSCALFAVIMRYQIGHFGKVTLFFENLNTLMLGVVPMTGVIYAMGGNVTTAVASNGTMYLFLAFCENFCAKTILPVCSACMAFALCGTLSPTLNLKSLLSSVKKTYTFLLALVMTLLIAVLSSQTILGVSADTVSSRAAKLVASTVIPVVGGSVGETIRTISSSVSYIKSVCGIGSVLFIIFLVLPTLVSLLLSRSVYLFAVAVADLLGCDAESRLLSEVGSVYGMICAVVSMVSIMFILALGIFVKCGIALG